MERQLEQTQASVSSLRALLVGDRPEAEVEHRSVGPTLTLAIRDRVAWDDAEAWLADAFGQLHAELDAGRGTVAGPDGALYASEFFEAHSGEVIAFVPVHRRVLALGESRGDRDPRRRARGHRAPGRVRRARSGVRRARVVRRERAPSERTGPIREHYLDPEGDDPSELRTEVAWPVSGPFA